MEVVQRLAAVIDGLADERVLIAFDGPDAAGKTLMARAVAHRLSRPAIGASVDGWHNPRDVRLRRGADCPEGYYRDAFDLDALVRDLLTPFRRGAAAVPLTRFDHRSNTAVQATQHVPPDAALLVDGVFLLRPELAASWTLRVYLDVPEGVTLARAVVRDLDLFGHEDVVRHRYERRYLPAQALYRAAASPRDRADIVIDNSDWQDPVVVRWLDER